MPPSSLTDLVNITSSGYYFADYPTFLAWLTAQYQAIYGADVYLGPDSMDGQFLAILAQAFYDTASLGASVYNSFSPLTAQGVGLSRVVKINGLTRLVPSYSTVTLTIGGTSGTIITNGIAQDILGQLWNLPTSVTIPSGGTIDVTGTAQIIGAVFADTNTITTIYTPTLGWQTVSNGAAATPGAPVENDAALRIRQSISTSIPAQTVLEATIGGVANVTGVTKVFGYENFTDSDSAQDLPPHSICIATVGGAAQDICNAILAYKTPGTDPVGSGSATCYDTQGVPIVIHYQPAVTAEIQVEVHVTPGQGWTTDYETPIAASIAAYLNALPIGSAIIYGSLFVPATFIGAPGQGTYGITDIQIGVNGGGVSHTEIILDQGLQGSGAQNPVCSPTVGVDITFVVA